MRQYVSALEQPEDAERQRALLDRIIAAPAVHARLLNTFSRMEYVGVRKLLKSRRSEGLDLDGLQHMLDETIHAIRLKKAALALAGEAEKAGAGLPVTTYAAPHTLAGEVGEAYLQGVDGAAEIALEDLAESDRVAVNHLLTSAAIEVRAQAFYPLYESCLRAHSVNVSVAAIMRDEDRHLGEMGQGLAAALPDWRARLERVLSAEQALFERFLSAIATEANALLAIAPMPSAEPTAPASP
ncbi:MAG TPA: hypothetical protein VGG33_24395 [Polyangia bacterium]